MGTYLIPRNLKGEGRILTIFSYKALAYTAVGGGIGFGFHYLLKLINLSTVGMIIMGLFALIGFFIGTFKMPNTKAFEITKKTGGEKIDDILIRLFKFKMKKNRIYIYKENKEETNE